MMVFTGSAHAATPPDSCFQFNSGTNTIEDYYDNEGNNGANPACPRDVDIPATIGGDAVTIIGSGSFVVKNITAVTIPSSVTTIEQNAFVFNSINSLSLPNSVISIQDNAFAHNDLTSLSLPNSVTTIGSGAFGGNHIESVVLPSSVISLDVAAFAVQAPPGYNFYMSFVASDFAGVQAAYDVMYFVKVYTEDPTNPNNLVSGTFTETAYTIDFNNNGSLDDSMGGHIINPVAASLSYKDTTGNSLLPDSLQTGSGGLTDYMVKNNPNNELERYYRLGSQQTFTPPSINGFITPASASFALNTAPTTSHNFVYQPNIVAGTNTSGSKLAATGQALKTAVFAAVTLILSGAFMARRMLKKRA